MTGLAEVKATAGVAGVNGIGVPFTNPVLRATAGTIGDQYIGVLLKLSPDTGEIVILKHLVNNTNSSKNLAACQDLSYPYWCGW